MKPDTALIALGGNLGDPHNTFIEARRELAETEGIDLIASSKLYRTPPVGPAGQPDYLNAVVSINTTLEPIELLEWLHRIENRHGRKRLPEQPRWGARTLDLDIIAMGEKTIETKTLSIPHPMMHKRLFVLYPLCDIDPNWQHPLLKVTAEQLMQQLIREGEAALPEGEVW